MRVATLSLFFALSGSAFADSSATYSVDEVANNTTVAPVPVGEVLEMSADFEVSGASTSEVSKSSSLVNRAYAGKETWGNLCNITDNLYDSAYSERTWTINLMSLASGTTEALFTSLRKRKIQSVVCSPFEGEVEVIFSMKESANGDYEIYQLVPGESPPFIKLTDNDTDDVDVTSNWSGSVVAWQNRLPDGRQAIQLTRFIDGNTSPIVKTLASASPFVQPSLSRNGEWLTFVQLRPSYFAVMRYDIENNKYKEIRKVPRRKKLFHPSISDDGNIVGWSENRNQNRYLVKNVSENTVTEVVNSPWGVEHGYLSAGGDMLVYSINNPGNGKYQTLITDLNSMETSRLGELRAYPERYLSSSWLGSSTLPILSSDLSGQVMVNPYEPNPLVLVFDSSGVGQELSNSFDYSFSGEYVHGFEWQVSADGRVVIDYNAVTDSVEDETGVVTATLNYQKDNKYNFHGFDSEVNAGFMTDFMKLKPLSVADLDGKILKGMTDGGQCLTSSKIDGNAVSTYSLCGGSVESSQSVLSNHPSLENVIIATDTEIDPWSGSNEYPETYIGLIEGEIAEGGDFTLIGIDEPRQNPVGEVFLEKLSLSEQEVMPVFDGKLVLTQEKYYQANQSSNRERKKILPITDEEVTSFAMDISEVRAYSYSSRVETDIRLKFRPNENTLTNELYAVMRLKQSNNGNVEIAPFIGMCLNDSCSNERWLEVPNLPQTSYDWSGFYGNTKLVVAFNESTQTFTFKLNNQVFKMGLEYFFNEVDVSPITLSGEDAKGEFRATVRNVSSSGDGAEIEVFVDAAYVNGVLYDDFEVTGEVASGKWDTSQVH